MERSRESTSPCRQAGGFDGLCWGMLHSPGILISTFCSDCDQDKREITCSSLVLLAAQKRQAAVQKKLSKLRSVVDRLGSILNWLSISSVYLARTILLVGIRWYKLATSRIGRFKFRYYLLLHKDTETQYPGINVNVPRDMMDRYLVE